MPAVKHVVVAGGGWAGCAAAVALVRAGHRVTLLEAARTLGGRARSVQAHGQQIDNGQHILLGAYSSALGLLREVGIDPHEALLHLPLQMCYPEGSGGMHFVAPRLPAPLHMGVALLRARGLTGADKMALARFSTSARWMGWTLHKDCSVSELLERFDQTARLTQLMWRPLCLAALNTAPERASAKVFLAVLRDSLGARRAASDRLIPRHVLSALFPLAAARRLEQAGASVRTGAKVDAITRHGDGWRIDASGSAVGGTWAVYADAVVVATPPPVAAALLHMPQLAAFEYEAITTCYLQYAPDTRLERAFFALPDDPVQGHWGQFVFDRGQLDPAYAGLMAVVISASGEAAALGQDALAQAVAAQLTGQLKLPAPQSSQVITEKRATFACTPGLLRPPNASGQRGLVLAGDYTASDYPATLEAAVRSGLAAAALLEKE